MEDKKQIFLILAGLCFLVYANSLNNAFVSDDIPAILQNPLISRPLAYWLNPSLFLNSTDYLIGRTNPFTYHLTNIILHSIATILVFLFLRQFFKTEPSFLASALFAIHPIHTEAVTWISGRPYIVITIFTIITYLLYCQAIQARKRAKNIAWAWYLFSFGIFTYFMIGNFTFYFLVPFLLILSDITTKNSRNNWRWWLPFLAVALFRIILAKALISQRINFVARDLGGASWSNPFYNMVYSIFLNFSLLVWPAKLTLYHEPPVISSFLLKVEITLFAILVFALPFIFKKAKEIFLGILLFILFLAPTYSPIMVSWLVAERYLYLPSITLCIFSAFFYNGYVSKAEKMRKKRAFILFVSIISAYAVRTVARNEDWKDAGRLWRQTVLASPNSPRTHNNMGDAYAQEGNSEGAIREFKKAIELKPNYADAYHNLANIYHRQGNLVEATKLYEQATAFNPELFESHFNLGIIYINKGDFTLAIKHLKAATAIRPDNVDVRAALNFALEKAK